MLTWPLLIVEAVVAFELPPQAAANSATGKSASTRRETILLGVNPPPPPVTCRMHKKATHACREDRRLGDAEKRGQPGPRRGHGSARAEHEQTGSWRLHLWARGGAASSSVTAAPPGSGRLELCRSPGGNVGDHDDASAQAGSLRWHERMTMWEPTTRLFRKMGHEQYVPRDVIASGRYRPQGRIRVVDYHDLYKIRTIKIVTVVELNGAHVGVFSAPPILSD